MMEPNKQTHSNTYFKNIYQHTNNSEGQNRTALDAMMVFFLAFINIEVIGYTGIVEEHEQTQAEPVDRTNLDDGEDELLKDIVDILIEGKRVSLQAVHLTEDVMKDAELHLANICIKHVKHVGKKAKICQTSTYNNCNDLLRYPVSLVIIKAVQKLTQI